MMRIRRKCGIKINTPKMQDYLTNNKYEYKANNGNGPMVSKIETTNNIQSSFGVWTHLFDGVHKARFTHRGRG